MPEAEKSEVIYPIKNFHSSIWATEVRDGEVGDILLIRSSRR